MKKLFSTVLLALVCQLASAQTSSASKDDDTAVVEFVGSPEDGWRKLAQVLVERGYSIEHSDKDLLTLTTHTLYRPGPWLGDGSARVAGTVVNGQLIVRMYFGGEEEKGGLQTTRVRRKNSNDWRELETIAQEVGRSVRYTTSKGQEQ
jgi:hypothetical protein